MAMSGSSTTPTIQPKTTLTLDLPPSCIQFCPAHPSYFVVGTYHLDTADVDAHNDSSAPQEDSGAKATQSRNGSLAAFRLNDGVPQLIQTVMQPSAVFHLTFGHLNGRQDHLAVVCSSGTLSVFRFTPGQSLSEPLQHVSTSRISGVEEGTMFLYCDWHPTLRDYLAITTSNGRTYLVDLDPATLSIKRSQELAVANTLECWCVAFSPDQPATSIDPGRQTFVVYTGGDDSILRYRTYNVKAALDGTVGEEMHVTTEIKKEHGAGVTAILPLPLMADGGRVVITGSYDDTLRVFHFLHDASHGSGGGISRVLAEKELGGGVWRLRTVSVDLVTVAGGQEMKQIRLAASCMHAGTRIIDIRILAAGHEAEIDVVGRFEEHKSMNYGTDFTRLDDGRVCVISTSFYDKLLCAWDLKL